MRIVIDLQGAQLASGSAEHDILALCQAIARNAGEHEVWLVLNARLPDSIFKIRAAFSELVPKQRIRIFDVPALDTPSPWADRSAEVIRERFLETLQPDVVLLTCLFEGYKSTVVTSIGATNARYKTAIVLNDHSAVPEQLTCLSDADAQAYAERKAKWLKNADALLATFDLANHQIIDSLELKQTRLFNISAPASSNARCDLSARHAIAALQTLDSKPIPAAAFSLSELYNTLWSLSDEVPSDEQLQRAARSIVYNFTDDQQPQLFLDVSCIVRTDARSGIQRVVRSLLQELFKSPPEGRQVRPVYYHEGGLYYADNFMANFKFRTETVPDSPIDYRQGDLYLSLDLNMHLTDELHPLLAQMSRMGVDINHIVYDLLLAQRPEWWPAVNAEYFKNWLDKISEISSRLICISAAVATELNQWLVEHPPQRVEPGPEIYSFHLGADIHNSMPSSGLPKSAERVLQEISARTSFLMVSTIEPRKGHAQTLLAFEKLWSQGLQVNLVVVGKRGWLTNDLISRLENHPEAGRKLFWLEGVSDEYLQKLYAASACLIAASEGEGFGLPLIEAAQQQLPMLVRDLPVFREVAGEHAFYFKGLHGDELASAITDWITLFQADQHPKSAAMPWLTWEQSANQLKSALQDSP